MPGEDEGRGRDRDRRRARSPARRAVAQRRCGDRSARHRRRAVNEGRGAGWIRAVRRPRVRAVTARGQASRDTRIRGRAEPQLVARDLHARGWRRVVLDDAVRVDLRAPRLSLLRRARLQDAVGDHAARAERPRRTREHAGRRADERRRRLHHRPVRGDASAANVSRRLRRRSVGVRGPGTRGQERGADADRRAPRPRRRREVRRGGLSRTLHAARIVVRHRLPVRQARPCGDPADRQFRDGERRSDHLRRRGIAGQARRRYTALPPRRGQRRRARNRPSVVRQLRHHGVVGRHLAQRGVRNVDRRQDRRPVEARLGPRRGAHRRTREGDRRGHAWLGAADSRARQVARRHLPRVRFDHLREGRDRYRHVRGLARRGAVPPRRAALSRIAAVRFGDRAGLPRRAGDDERPAGDAGVRHLPQSERRSAARRPARVRHGRRKGRPRSAPSGAARFRVDGSAPLADPGVPALRQGAHMHAADRGERDGSASRRVSRLRVRQRRRPRLLRARLRRRFAGASRRASQRPFRGRVREPARRPASAASRRGRDGRAGDTVGAPGRPVARPPCRHRGARPRRVPWQHGRQQ